MDIFYDFPKDEEIVIIGQFPRQELGHFFKQAISLL